MKLARKHYALVLCGIDNDVSAYQQTGPDDDSWRERHQESHIDHLDLCVKDFQRVYCHPGELPDRKADLKYGTGLMRRQSAKYRNRFRETYLLGNNAEREEELTLGESQLL